MSSHDIEDIAAVLDGRPELLAELEAADAAAKTEIAARFEELRKDPGFIEAIAGHMPPDSASQARVQGVLDTINDLRQLR